MRKFLLGTAAATGLAASAMAADMPVKAPPIAVATFYNWTGCYIGGTVGANQSRSRFDWVLAPGFPDPAVFIAGRTAGAAATLRSSGLTGGAEAGCNYQTGRLVFGIEADIEHLGGQASRFQDLVPFGLPAGNTVTESFKTSWLATLRTRAGIAADRLYLYGTGGVALARVNFFDRTDYPGTFNQASFTVNRAGWVIGAGIEYAFGHNWTGKVEYLHAEFGNTSTGSVAVGAPTAIITHNHSLSTDIVRAGLNYRFGGPVVARY